MELHALFLATRIMHSCIGISLLCVSFQCRGFSSTGLTLAVVASQFGWTM